MILYGIPSCDSCRKALKEIRAAGQEVEFRDIRTEPLTEAERGEFLDAFGDALINRASTTWRGLSEEERAGDAGALLAANPTLMKRPVIREGESLHLGWKPDTRARVLKA
ncbi:arsenate reductase family protein [Ostreiculturibacter nitratireducens]|uniref:arsenate reductase family protein n=1 Tax=Ostreiculturibacter nitratireducens TaxID=3075226 RepID=UPI0031B5968C